MNRVLVLVMIFSLPGFAFAGETSFSSLVDYFNSSPEQITSAVTQHVAAIESANQASNQGAIQSFQSSFPNWNGTFDVKGRARALFGPPLVDVPSARLPKTSIVHKSGRASPRMYSPTFSGPERVFATTPSVNSLTLSPFKTANFQVSGALYFRRIDGIPRANSSNASPVSFVFKTKFLTVSPSGASNVNEMREPLSTSGCPRPESTPVPEKPVCGYTEQHYTDKMPLTLDSEEGLWNWKLQYEVVRLETGVAQRVLYAGELGGEFYLDRTQPTLSFDLPGENATLAFPQGVLSLQFSFGDFGSGVEQETFLVSSNHSVSEIASSLAMGTANIDLSGVQGTVSIRASVADKAGNISSKTFSIEIVSPEVVSARLQAEGAILELAPFLGIHNLTDVSYLMVNSDSGFADDTTDVPTPQGSILSFQQKGPGGYLVEGGEIKVVVRDGYVVEVYSSFATEVTNQVVPPTLVKEWQAVNTAVAASDPFGTVKFTKRYEDVKWAYNDSAQQWRLVYEIVLLTDDQDGASWVARIDAESGTLTQLAPFGAAFDATLAWTVDYVTYDQWGFPNYNDVTVRTTEPGYSYYYGSDGVPYLMSDYVHPWNHSVAINADHVYTSPIATTNSMKKVTEMAQYFKTRFGKSVYFPYNGDTYIAQGVELAKSDYNPSAVAIPSFNSCSIVDLYDYWYGNCSKSLSTLDGGTINYTNGYGTDHSTAYHEATHIMLYSLGWISTTNTIDRVQEGTAAAMQCLYYQPRCHLQVYCRDPFGEYSFECSWRDGSYDYRYLPGQDDIWHHYTGSMMSAAAADIEARLKVYWNRSYERPGLLALWGSLARTTFGSADVLLGALADTYVSYVGSTFSLIDYNEFKWEIYYFFQHHGMGVGAAAGKNPSQTHLLGYMAHPHFGNANIHNIGAPMRIFIVGSGDSLSHWVLEFYKNNAGTGTSCSTQGGFSGFLGINGLFNDDEETSTIRRKTVKEDVIDDAIRECFTDANVGNYTLYVKLRAINLVSDTSQQLIYAPVPPGATLPRLRVYWPGQAAAGGGGGGGGCRTGQTGDLAVSLVAVMILFRVRRAWHN